MELCSQVLHGEILHPERGFQPVPTSVEVRWDPLTGHGARLVIAPPGALFPRTDPKADVSELTFLSRADRTGDAAAAYGDLAARASAAWPGGAVPQLDRLRSAPLGVGV